MLTPNVNVDGRARHRYLVVSSLLVATFAALLLAAPAVAAPGATTAPATAVHHYSAVLNGHLDPEGETVTDCHFDWGTDTSYGNSAPCAQGNSFSAPTDVSASIGFLTPGQPYHFRLNITTSTSGQLTGADQTFSVLPLSVTHSELGAFGPDGTAATMFSGNRFGSLALNPLTRKLFVTDGNNDAAGSIWGFDVSNPPSFPHVSGFNPLAIGPVGNSAPQMAVDATAGAGAGNLYRVLGDEKNESQTLTVSATAGSFKLTFDTCTTGDLPVGAEKDTVEAALNSLSCLGGALVNHPFWAPESYFLSFHARGTNYPQLSCSNGAIPLSGGAVVRSQPQKMGHRV